MRTRGGTGIPRGLLRGGLSRNPDFANLSSWRIVQIDGKCRLFNSVVAPVRGPSSSRSACGSGKDDPVPFHSDHMGAVLDQVVQVEVACDLGGLGGLSAVILAGLKEDIDYRPVVEDGEVAGADGIPAADVAGGGELVAEDDPDIDVVPIMDEEDLLHLWVSQVFPGGDENAGYPHPPVESTQVRLVVVKERAAGPYYPYYPY